ncbi:RNA polymerase sigma-70 factor [uncultured Parabacteroides sp.]|jgi:RNA polymerase sigma-70 factor (ECF subfamily)|uniref:RNA polymerase sigma-70 factor n=1 Tax=uncultured Parabacteroides sp. TaxID=512312 RepID=UPI00258A4984|nr:RNA polymerase sigma-70 factor [uncultured Parabacteroides sp.]
MENISEIKEFNKLFSNYRGIFIRFANTYIQNEDTAEDIVVDSLVYYWENRHSLASKSNIPAYIMEVVKHKSLNYLRNQRIREDIEQNLWAHMDRVRKLKITTLEACNPEELFSSEAQQLVDKALDSLPEKTQTIFIMSRYENKKHKEIAEHFNLSTKSIEFHISKALDVLRKELKDYLPLFIIFLNQ